jgi:hypothetical protein
LTFCGALAEELMEGLLMVAGMVRAVVVVVAAAVSSLGPIGNHMATEDDILDPFRGLSSLHFAFFEEDTALSPCTVDLEAAWSCTVEVVQETASTANTREAAAEKQLRLDQGYPAMVVYCIRSAEAEVRFHTSLQVVAMMGFQGLAQMFLMGRHSTLYMMEPVVTLRESNWGQALLMSIPGKE